MWLLLLLLLVFVRLLLLWLKNGLIWCLVIGSRFMHVVLIDGVGAAATTTPFRIGMRPGRGGNVEAMVEFDALLLTDMAGALIEADDDDGDR